MCILSMALSFLACEADDKMDMDKVEVPSGYALSAGTSTIFLNSSIAYDTEASWVSGKYASRFTNGAYIHGVPVNAPGTEIIEWSWSLGTTPRSHMCVRNATSHARFIYDTMPLLATLVVVIE